MVGHPAEDPREGLGDISQRRADKRGGVELDQGGTGEHGSGKHDASQVEDDVCQAGAQSPGATAQEHQVQPDLQQDQQVDPRQVGEEGAESMGMCVHAPSIMNQAPTHCG